MNRETKIGLVTGLAVIVLIGVLLLEYLGGGAGRERTARPANLSGDLGEAYRHSVISPQGVPPADGRFAPVADGRGTGGLDLSARDLTAYARSGGSGDTPGMGGGPVIGPVVTPIPAGDIPVGGRPDRGGPLELLPLSGGGGLSSAVYVVPGSPALVATTTAPSTNPTYTIVKGDTLMVIAKKFYHQATKADIARIVLANSAMLKDDKTPLMIGKKLVIPPAPQPVVARVPDVVPGVRVPGDAGRPDSRTPIVDVPRPVIIGMPGTGRTDGVRSEPRADAGATPLVAPRTYVVQKGDSLEKIARKFLGSGAKEAVARIVALNKIKDADSIQEGMTLRIPAKGETVARPVVVAARG